MTPLQSLALLVVFAVGAGALAVVCEHLSAELNRKMKGDNDD